MKVTGTDDRNCGNGICWGLNGENEDSCFVDCLGGPCEELIDCLGQRWYETGDGTYDTLNGETPTSCLVDCQAGYSCTKSSDCNALTLPDGCTGDWICASQLCVPQCE